MDQHLSHVPQSVGYGFFGNLDYAVVEATEITHDGRAYLTTSIGASPTYLKYADKVIIEMNEVQSERLREFADIMMIPQPPHHYPIQLYDPMGRIGVPYAVVDPKKIIGIVVSNEPDSVNGFSAVDSFGRQIAAHVVKFLIVMTEQGLADLRGLGPQQRAIQIIDKCAHPLYKNYLRHYLETALIGHIKHDLTRCYELHRNLMETGERLPEMRNKSKLI